MKQKSTITGAIRSFFASRYPEIAAVYIFGSFVDADRFSDVDIAILLRNDIADPLSFELELETQLEKRIHYSVDIRILNSAPTSFAAAVVRTGIVVIDRAPDFRADFSSLLLRKYFDFKHFREEYLKEVAHAPI